MYSDLSLKNGHQVAITGRQPIYHEKKVVNQVPLDLRRACDLLALVLAAIIGPCW